MGICSLDLSATLPMRAPLPAALITSKPEERDRITALIEKTGDVHSGIAAWVRKQSVMRG